TFARSFDKSIAPSPISPTRSAAASPKSVTAPSVSLIESFNPPIIAPTKGSSAASGKISISTPSAASTTFCNVSTTTSCTAVSKRSPRPLEKSTINSPFSPTSTSSSASYSNTSEIASSKLFKASTASDNSPTPSIVNNSGGIIELCKSSTVSSTSLTAPVASPVISPNASSKTGKSSIVTAVQSTDTFASLASIST